MECLAQPHHHLNRHRPPLLKSTSSLSNKTLILYPSPKLKSIRASSSSPTSDPLHQNHKPSLLQSLTPLFSPLLRATCIAAALLLTRLHHKPALASPAAPPPVVEPSGESADEEEDYRPEPEELETMLLGKLFEDPKDIEALKALAEVRTELGKHKSAILALDYLIELQPEEPEWLLWRSIIQFHEEDFESAMEGYKKVLEMDPICPQAHAGLMASAVECDLPLKKIVEIVKKIEEAVESCKKDNDTENSRTLRILLGEAYYNEENYDKALKVLEEVVAEDLTDCRPYLYLGLIHTVMMNKDEAAKQFANYAKHGSGNNPYEMDFDAEIKEIKQWGKELEKQKKEGILL